MAEKSTIARPYAQAFFEVARSKGILPQMADALDAAAIAATDRAFVGLVGDPSVSKENLAALIIGVCGEDVGEEFSSFMKLLAENGRLDVLPQISELFNAYRSEEEQTVEAEVISAVELSAAQKKKISESLKKRLGRKVTLQCHLDESIIGGAIIRAGDLVVDGSVTGQLNKLTQALSR